MASPFSGVRSVMSRYHSERDITEPKSWMSWPIVTLAGRPAPRAPWG